MTVVAAIKLTVVAAIQLTVGSVCSTPSIEKAEEHTSFVWEAGSDLGGGLAAICVGGWQRFEWEAGSDLCGRLAVICAP